MKTFCFSLLLILAGNFLNAQGLELIKDFRPGMENGLFYPDEVAFINDVMVFTAIDPQVGREIFGIRNDSVFLLKDISPGQGGANPRGFFHFKDQLYSFVSASNALEIWKTDGTEEGTMKAISFSGSTFNYNSNFIVAGDKFYFTRNDRIYVSDGTQAGTMEIPSSPEVAFEEEYVFLTLNADKFGDGIAFLVDQDTAFQLYSAKDTTITHLGSIDISSDDSFSVLGPFEVLRGLVVMVRNGSSSVGDLYLFDKATGTLSKYNTTKVVPARVNRINQDRLLITTYDDGNFVTNGTNAGTTRILTTSAPPSSGEYLPFIRIGNSAFFHGDEPFGGDAIHVTNGTTPGTRLIKSIPGNGMSNFVSRGTHAFWIHDNQFNGQPQIWWGDINGTSATMLYEHPTTFNNVTFEIDPVGVTDKKIYFFAKVDSDIGKELYALEHNLEISTSVFEGIKRINCEVIHDRDRALFKVILQNSHERLDVSVSDMSGRIISTLSALDNTWLSLPNLPGAYVVSIRNTEGQFSQVIIQ